MLTDPVNFVDPEGREGSGMLGSAINLAQDAYVKLTTGSPGSSSGSQ